MTLLAGYALLCVGFLLGWCACVVLTGRLRRADVEDEPVNHDFAVMRDGTHKPIDDFEPGTLLVAVQTREVRQIVHVRSPRPFGAWVQRNPKPLTASQQRCVEGVP